MTSRNKFLFCLFISLLTVAVYWQIQGHDFIILDDPSYIYNNNHVTKGLNIESVEWAFTQSHVANWHPITWISHILDYEFYELEPGGHHRTNLIFHTANAILLFLVLMRMTGGFWQSVVVATLFAIHPLHVESVAWISERKDVLSMFFMMLTIWAYIQYVEKRELKNYLLVVLFFVLGLMSKSMLVTLPFVLILLDFWPLNRMSGNFRQIIIEKIPLFALAITSSLITFYVQQNDGATKSLAYYSIQSRIFNAITSYIEYLHKMVWPINLSILYPHPGQVLLTWKVTLSAVILIWITLIAVKIIRQAPFVLVGWFWYLGTLVPVIGFVQVGGQAMADRYTYIPLIGIFIIVAWGFPYLLKNIHQKKRILIVSSVVMTSIFAFASWSQAKYWKNSIVLFNHAIEVVDDENRNFALAYSSLGLEYYKNKEYKKALFNLKKCIKLDPDHWRCYHNIGETLVQKKELHKAIRYFKHGIKLNSKNYLGHNNIGVVLQRMGKLEESIKHFKKSIDLEPDQLLSYYNLGKMLSENNRNNEAIIQYKKALKNDPKSFMIHVGLGNALAQKGFYQKSIDHYKMALKIKPDLLPAQENLKIVKSTMDKQ